MKIVAFQSKQLDRVSWRLGLVKDGYIADVHQASQALKVNVVNSLTDFYSQGLAALAGLEQLLSQDLSAFSYPEAEVSIGPATPNPGKILCVGLNYRKHAEESGAAIPKEPVLFSKFNNALAANGDKIAINGLSQVDYESELAFIIGKQAKGISEADALNYVLGYANANDLSERKLQFTSTQWLLGKSLDNFLPIGPYLVTADEVGDPQQLSIKGWLNGELKQNSHTSDMIFSIAQIIAYASRYMTLNPGDVIITGTPEGVILGMKEKIWLKAGDSYSVEIDKLGRLENHFV